MKKPISFQIEDNIFCACCFFYIGDKDKCAGLIEKDFGERPGIPEECLGTHYAGYNEELDMFERWIWLPSYETIEDTAVLVHEITHLVDRIFNDKYILQDYTNTEVRASYMSFWLKGFLEHYKNHST